MLGANEWLAGGGEMAALMRAKDWSRTPLGPVESWPQSLRSAVSILLPSKAQIVLFWGPEFITLYNDAYRPVFGAKHPHALGMPAREAWSEIWHTGLRDLFEGVRGTGEAFWAKDRPFFLQRHGYPEETFFDVSYDPVRDESGGIGGLFCIVSETTSRIVGERRLKLLRDLAAGGSEARSVADACALSEKVLRSDPQDVPFAEIDLGNRRGWPVGLHRIESLKHRFARMPEGPWPEPPRSVMVLSLPERALDKPSGVLVLGVSSRLPFDDAYRSFFELVAGQVAASISNARASEEERKRAEALAQLDRAKTVFFSNVSHEFRTPLTLILGPLEEALAQASLPQERERLELMRRNALRMQRLVNTLLDFSRIEAGRAGARYRATDLAALTAELASNFRSACEAAGIRLTVDCSDLTEAYVDREMWEKIVLNLLSNAFKFTPQGEISVSLKRAAGRAYLSVRDTGIGIPAAELPHIFKRFHRVESARGRTKEGTGIGLALVRELVKLHGGEVQAISKEGRGSEFLVSIPLGAAHLPADRVRPESSRAAAPRSATAAAFVEEMLRWLPGRDAAAEGLDEPEAVPTTAAGSRVLIADDNADMREYLARLLRPAYDVEVAGDGAQALEAVRRRAPDLVLCDVMMPGMDGFALLRELRANEGTRTIPIVMLSARAGEEARIAGLDSGADDYLVKPFSARELLARVQSQLELARLRKQAEVDLRRRGVQFKTLLDQAPLGVYLVDADLRIRELNPVALPAFGDIPGGVVGRDFGEIMHIVWDKNYADEMVRMLRHTLDTGEPYVTPERAEYRIDRGVTEYYEWRLDRIPLPDGRNGVVCYFRDISAHVLARKALEESREALRAADRRKDEFIAMLAHELRNPLGAIFLATEILEHSPSDARSRRALQSIERQNAHLQRLVDDLLDVARATYGKIELERRPLELLEAARGAVAAYPAGQARIEVSGEPAWVDGDPARLHQMIGNLLDNAVKYGAKNVRVRVAPEGDRVRASVEDDGSGIAPELLPHLFEPFVQGAQSLERSQGGLGLGLALVNRLAALHGGTIKAESDGSGKGSRFTLSLPRVERAAAVEEKKPAAQKRKRRILVVEDERDSREAMCALLEMEGHDVAFAEDGVDGLAKLESFRPEVALVDVGLPGMDGYELARRARSLPGGTGIRLVAVTGYGKEGDRSKARDAGFDAHLTKPVTYGKLEASFAR